MRKLASKGIGIIFISHRLDEIVEVADRVTILRDGEHVATKDIKDTNTAEIAQLMVGRKVTINRENKDEKNLSEEVMLQIRNLKVAMPGEMVKGIDLDVKKGQILGIGGLAGQGKLGLANGIMGVYEASGQVMFNGKELPLNNAKNAIKSGLGFVSEDRKGDGLLVDLSVRENMTLSSLNRISKGLIIDKKHENERVDSYIERINIKTPSKEQLIRNLSGGNQQKVAIAKAMMIHPEVLILDEPTRGVDVGAKKEIYDLINEFKSQGKAVIMISSEMPEILGLSDRILVLSQGVITGEFDIKDASQEAILKCAVETKEAI